MNILLINPYIYDFAAFDLWVKPLGLLYIGSFLEHYGYRVRLIDCLDRLHPALPKRGKDKKFSTGKFPSEETPKPVPLESIPRKFKRYGLPPHVFKEELARSEKPDLIIITSIMTYWYLGVFEAIQTVKKVLPDTPVILGGVYPTLCREHAVKHSQADYIISGNGTVEVLKIADTLSGRMRNYADCTTGLDVIPYPAYHLYQKLSSVSMLTSLGCPYQCTYCASRIIQPQFTERAPDSVFAEIMYYLSAFSIQDIAFYDDALLINAERRFIPLAEKIIQRTLSVRFHTPNGLNLRCITPTTAKLLHQAQFKTIRLSFESAHPRIQQNSSLKTTNQELINAKKYLEEAGYQSSELEVYVMVGLPEQNQADVINSIRFVNDLGLTVKLVQYSPIPGTPDYERTVKKYPRVATDPLFHNNSVFSLMSDEIGYEGLCDIKELVQELNTNR